jgi:hypothetical protein
MAKVRRIVRALPKPLMGIVTVLFAPVGASDAARPYSGAEPKAA